MKRTRGPRAAGLFPKYVRDSQYHVRPFETWVKPPEIRAACLTSLQRFYSPPKTTPLLLDGIRLTERFFASSGHRRANALPYIGRFITHALSLSPYLSLGIPPLRRNRFPLDALAAPRPSSPRKRRSRKESVPKASAQKTGAQPVSKPKPKPKPTPKPKYFLQAIYRSQPQQRLYCEACDMGMLPARWRRICGASDTAQCRAAFTYKRSVLRKQGPKGVRSVRPRGGAPCIVVR
ncbi:hypothetical protein BD779DRAFT_1517812 [Infundibulicybe gibba]|nr:hypothetical protein BD779DRAFT_1517812 [Infundibulicybe gibba]